MQLTVYTSTFVHMNVILWSSFCQSGGSQGYIYLNVQYALIQRMDPKILLARG